MGWDAKGMGPCMMKWRLLSPSAHVMVDPASGARGIIRDTGADGASGFSLERGATLDPTRRKR
jgi:hypothetical protein